MAVYIPDCKISLASFVLHFLIVKADGAIRLHMST